MPNPEGATGPATLTYEGTTLELPVVRPTLGRTALDISAIGTKGLSVLDPGYADTAAYQSAITFVDGEEGRLYYRGLPGGAIGHVDIVPRRGVPAHKRRAAHRPGRRRVHGPGTGP